MIEPNDLVVRRRVNRGRASDAGQIGASEPRLLPPQLPQPIVQRIAAETSKALESPEIVAKTKELYMSRIYSPPEAFTAMIRNAVDSYAKIVKAAGIKPE